MNQQGILVVISGFSGAGKGTLMRALMEKYHNYALSVSATTRQPRAGEVDGREYFFVSQEHFKSMVENEALIEYAQYVDNYYGTPKDYVEKQRADGRDVILEIEIQGALKIKKKFPDTLLLFITPPNANELKRRLISRGTESADVIEARLKRAAEEAVGIEAYDYIIINDKIDDCVEELHHLIQAQHSKTSNRLDFINEVRNELNQL
ncbi:MAG: guanylate kinase [Lachnospiraceae bacterium]|jgi:guanylate kinase|nr:guanylate kinase [Lachnospiraceae bacterium]